VSATMGGPRFVRAATPTWLHANVKAKTAYLTLIAGWSDADGGLNFDGYSNGTMLVTVPLGWHVQVAFSNHSAAPHSVEVIAYHTPVPETGVRAAFKNAQSPDAQALRAELGARADALLAERVDATDDAALTRFIDGAVVAFGHLDALVNVIGGFAGGWPLHETDATTWDHMLDLNLRTVYLACHAAVPHLLRTGHGVPCPESSVGQAQAHPPEPPDPDASWACGSGSLHP
jgi:NAD(P)-dependent dehydrogenase (short-subunit alcohol dehydrogenase family)